MPMTGDGLKAALMTALGVTDDKSNEVIGKFSSALVTYIQANAAITPDTIPALGLVSPGGMTPSPVTGAAVGSGTSRIT